MVRQQMVGDTVISNILLDVNLNFYDAVVLLLLDKITSMVIASYVREE